MDVHELQLPEDDYNLHEFFPKPIKEKIQPFIEHRVKLILKNNISFRGGEVKVVDTSCILGGKLRGTQLSMYLIPAENMFGLEFQSSGFISEDFKGRVLVKIANYSAQKIKLQSGIHIGYIVMTPYSLEM